MEVNKSELEASSLNISKSILDERLERRLIDSEVVSMSKIENEQQNIINSED